MSAVAPGRTGTAQAEASAEEPASGNSLLGSLVIAARQRGLQLSVPQLVRDHLLEPGMPSMPQLLHIAEKSGLRASLARLSWDDLANLDQALPAIVLLRNGSAMVLRQVHPAGGLPCVVLQDPNAREDLPLTLDRARFTAAWTGEVILLKRDYHLRDEDQPFGLKLIVGQLVRDRRITRDLAIAASTLSLLAIAPIMFWRLLIDRVLYYGSLDTLAVLCVAMVVLIGFETAFAYLRRYLVLYSTQRIDAKISTYMFDKVLALPLDFFERNPVGTITRDMNEIWRIRNFLTGQLFGTVLDAIVLFVFVPVMFFFSPLLTFCVLGISALICLWIIVRAAAAAADQLAGVPGGRRQRRLPGGDLARRAHGQVAGP